MPEKIFYVKRRKYNCIKNGVPYFRIAVMLDGKRREFYGDGEKDATHLVTAARKVVQQGLSYDTRKDKFGPVMKYWLFNVKRVDKNIKASSFSRYETIFRLRIDKQPIAKRIISTLRSGDIQAFITALYEEQKLSGANIESIVKLLRMFFNWALEEGYVTKNPCRNITLPGKHIKTKIRIETFSDLERKRLSKYMDTHPYQYDTIIRLAFATGMRMGELLSLMWSDIERDVIHVNRSTAVVTHVDKDGDRKRYREIWDTKTANSVRDIPIRNSTYRMLQEHKRKQDIYFKKNNLPKSLYVFTTGRGRLIDPASFRKSYKRLLDRAGLPRKRFHDIRHTFATEAIRKGVDVKDLQILMGHADISTTYVYVHASQDTQKNAVEMIGELL